MTALAAAPTPAVARFLEQHRYLVLASHDPDGAIHLVPVVYLFTGGCFHVATASSTRKARNLAARPDVTVTVDDRDAIGWVSAVGTARLVPPPLSRELNHAVYATWMTEEGLEVVGAALHEVEDVTVVITPRRWRAWDLATAFFPPMRAAGIPIDDVDRWFRI